MPVSINKFTVKPVSRHPKLRNAYDSSTRAYKATYIKPEKWSISILLDLAMELEKNESALSAGTLLKPSIKQQLLRAIAALQEQLSKVNIQFKVTNQRTGFSATTPVNKYQTTVEVPALGRYEVELRITTKSTGITTTKTQEYILEDIVILSFGDSYAAGEGNPDKPGTPTEAMVRYAEFSSERLSVHLQEDMEDLRKTTGRPGQRVTPETKFAEWQEPLAHRSYLSGHFKSIPRIEGQYGNKLIFTTFLSYSRSGALIENGLIRPNPEKLHPHRQLKVSKKIGGVRKTFIEHDEPGSMDLFVGKGQIDEARAAIGDLKVDIVLLTIGGNDLYWSSTMPEFMKGDGELWRFYLGERNDDAAREKIMRKTIDALGDLSEKYKRLNTYIQSKLNPKFIVITDYPNGFFGSKTSNGAVGVKAKCGIFETVLDANVDNEDARLIRNLSILLNQKIKDVADFHKWILVEVGDAFDIHGYCVDDTYFVSAERSFKTQGDWYGMLHPNEKGHDAYGQRIGNRIRQLIQDNIQHFISEPGSGLPNRPSGTGTLPKTTG